MTTPWRVPPGRAGRLWLRRRLDAAERGLDLHERKLRVLSREHRRRAADAARTGAEWAAACAAADAWLLRASLACGRRSLRPAAGRVEVTVDWTQVMGVGHPGAVSVTPAEARAPDPLPGSVALVRARQCCARALEAAARHAVAQEAERVLAAEIAVARRRIRVLEDRWIPGLTALLTELDLALEEAERSDAARLLRAAGRNRPVGKGATTSRHLRRLTR